MLNELRNRGLTDILIAVLEGLQGVPEAINAVWPQTRVPTCIVPRIRNALDEVSYADRRDGVAALQTIYTAPSAAAALEALDAFETGAWGRQYPAIAPTDRFAMAAAVAASDALLCVPARSAPDPLSDQRDREPHQQNPQRRP